MRLAPAGIESKTPATEVEMDELGSLIEPPRRATDHRERMDAFMRDASPVQVWCGTEAGVGEPPLGKGRLQEPSVTRN